MPSPKSWSLLSPQSSFLGDVRRFEFAGDLTGCFSFSQPFDYKKNVSFVSILIIYYNILLYLLSTLFLGEERIVETLSFLS